MFTLKTKQTLSIAVCKSIFLLFSIIGTSTYAQDGFNGYFIGNSLTVHDEGPTALSVLARNAGHIKAENHQTINWGAGLWWIWQNPDAGLTYDGRTDFVKYPVGLDAKNAYDFLSVEPYGPDVSADIDFGGRFYDMALKGNKDCQLYIYMVWTTKGQTIASTSDNTRQPEYFEKVAEGIQAAHLANKPVYVIPVGIVIDRLKALIKLGTLPGVTNEDQLFEKDDELHLNSIGCYAVVLTWYSTIYKYNPTQATNDFSSYWWGYTIPVATADKIKEVVWDVVSKYPKSGVTSSSTSSGDGKVTREFWTAIGGSALNDIPVNTVPSGTTELTSLECPVDWADNYGTRIRGYIIPEITGDYNFYLSSDDNSELRLSIDSNPDNKQKIASVSSWTYNKEWTKLDEQKSTIKTLVAGQKYYFEVLQKEATGGDNLAVGWAGPGIAGISVIGGGNISSYTSTPTSGNGTGSGLSAFYFNNTDLSGSPVLTRRDAVIDFNWGADSPALGTVNSDNFSIRWEGQVKAPVSGDYYFQTESDNGVRLWVNDIQVINNWSAHDLVTDVQNPSFNLTAGQRYNIKMEYYDLTGIAVAILRWAYPTQNATEVPATRLYPLISANSSSARKMAKETFALNSDFSDLVVYPNPASDFVTFKYTKEPIQQIELSNEVGKIFICEEGIHIPQNLNISNLPSGTYYLKIRTHSTSIVKRLLKF